MLSKREREEVASWIRDGVDWSRQEVNEFLDRMDDQNGTDRILYAIMREDVEFDEELANEFNLYHEDP